MSKSFAVQINRLPDDPALRAVLKYLCTTSNNLYNSTLYLARQLYFKTNQFPHGYWLCSQMKQNPNMRALYANAAQQTCITVGEAFKSFKALLKLWRRGELPHKPKPPHYRKSGGMFQVSYPKHWLKWVDGKIKVPMGRSCKIWFNLPEIFIPFPSNLDWQTIRELQIVPRAGHFDAVWTYTSPAIAPVSLDPHKALSIDHGVDNWLTCVDTEGHSFIVDGKHLKSLNQGYNKRIATIKEGKDQSFWCKLLDRLTSKRNRQMRHAINKAARIVVNHCLKHKIGTLVFGWNKGQKNGIKLDHKTNQKFVSIPTGKLKNRLEELCCFYGIQFIEQEESYTSQASALDLDSIPVYGEKPEGWKASGQRIRRGTYRSTSGVEVNADANGAWNIGKKAKVTGMQSTPARGVLTSPRRLRIWDLPNPLNQTQKCCNPSGEFP
ncbi:transposase [Spirulina sp. CCNP1310]|uniref:RNA-guided endonuclease InsQ/TnpB family protein n=1 Tax=Spirulina sp. CCNP1310 TaxID=3110249 RepID=UPI002B1FC178|nr:transposase [Spirulina sp. CCNP1310]MEA5419160.1 transposase [Spirulina sp. CCNP1310]